MFDINEIDLNEAFGLTAEESAGENEAETADQPQTENDEGENESDAADQTEVEDEGGDEESSAEPDEGKEKQSKEDNAKFAAARRKAEAEVDKRVKDALDSRFARMDMTDPYTNKKITTADEFDAYLSKLEDERRESMAKKAGMSKEEFDDYIQSQPEVKEAKAEREAAQRQAVQARLAEELKEISKLDPTIREIGDIAKSENGQQISEYVNRGYSLLDAFRIANFDRLMREDEAAERQRVYNNNAGKAHLVRSKARGQGMAEVPKETKEYYKIYFPHMSDSDIQKEYNKWENKK